MGRSHPSALWAYSSAVLATAVATAARVLLDRAFAYHHPYATFYLAVLWTAWYAGLGPALLAIGLGGISAAALILHPVLGVHIASTLVGFEFYFIVTLTATFLIEAQRKAQRNAERAEAQMRLTYEHAPVGICRLGLDGRFLELNPRLAAITGYSRAELLCRRLQDLIHPDDRAGDGGERFQQLLAGLVPFFILEKRFLQRSGAAIWANTTVSLVRDRAGNPDYAVAIVQDVTEQKQSEERLRNVQKLESVGLLAGGIAHDFNNLMTGILGYASLALEAVQPGDPVRRSLSRIVEAAERAAHLTRELLAYAGKGQFVVAPLNLSEMVRQTETLLRPSLSDRVRIRLELADDLPEIAADSRQIQQLIANLVLNAAEAIGEDQAGVVTIRTALRHMEGPAAAPVPAVGELAPGDYVVLEIQDTGVGMDPPTIARIFEPFFSTKFTGRGLGLAAVSGIVRSLGGAILVSSRPGQGATLTVLLPTLANHSPAAPSKAIQGTL